MERKREAETLDKEMKEKLKETKGAKTLSYFEFSHAPKRAAQRKFSELRKEIFLSKYRKCCISRPNKLPYFVHSYCYCF